MANLLSLKRRIQTARNVSKTTRAMQMIAASKLKKAQTAALSLRTYAQKLITLSQNLTTKIQKENLPAFMTERFDTKKTLIIILSPDKGLCGGLITNLVKEFLKISSSKEEFLYITVGKKAERQVINLTKNEILASFQFGSTNPTFDMVYPIVRIIDEYFIGKKVDAVKILYAQFENVFTQKPKITTLLPITISQNATTNAKDVISELRLEYNKSRQEKITNEILDITNTGAIK